MLLRLLPSIEEIALSSEGHPIQLVVLGGEAVFRLLLQHGVQLQPGYIVHCRAFAYANVPILRMFLDARFSLDVQGSDHGTLVVSLELDECRGNTLLALAAQAEYRNAAEGAVDLFLEHGAQLNPPAGSCNHTPLLCTVLEVAKRNVETTKEFVKEIIKSKAHELIAEQLRRYCDKFSEDEVLAIKLLLGKGPDPIFWNRSGKSALIVAAGARRNDIRGVKMLLLEYVDQNIAISTTKSHVLAPTGPDDDSDGTHWAKEEPSLTIQRTLWHYYQRKVYPCPSK